MPGQILPGMGLVGGINCSVLPLHLIWNGSSYTLIIMPAKIWCLCLSPALAISTIVAPFSVLVWEEGKREEGRGKIIYSSLVPIYHKFRRQPAIFNCSFGLSKASLLDSCNFCLSTRVVLALAVALLFA